MRKQYGMNTVSLCIALLITVIVTVFTTNAAWKAGEGLVKGLEIEFFAREAFIAIKPYYLGYANDNGYCYTAAPPVTIISSLVSQQYLENSWLNTTWYDAANSQVSFLKNSAGLVQTMVLEVPVNAGITSRLGRLAYQYSKTETSITFHKNLDLNIDHVITASLNSSGCQE